MKKKILAKIAKKLLEFNMLQTPEQAYKELCDCSSRCFGELCYIYRLTKEEENFVWNDSLEMY